VTRRRRLAVGAALIVLALDLVQLALSPTQFHHVRSAAWIVLTGTLAAAILALAPRVPSPALALAGGVAAGGALGNLVSALVWSAGVPDPIVVGAYALNLADVAVVVGVCAMVTAALVTAWTNRGSLREPV
jgi:lipoprotein signal peptidase